MTTAKQRQRAAGSDAAAVACEYFARLDAHDVDGAVALFAPGARDTVHGMLDVTAPDGVRSFVRSIFAAVPDARFRVTGTTTEGERCVVQWEMTGTFAGDPFQGIAATGARLELVGCDAVEVVDGRIAAIDAYMDGMTFARQAGAMPPAGSRQEARLQRALNARTRLEQRLHAAAPEEVADGVWVLRGGFPQRTMNVYFIRDGAGVLVFDAGIKAMGKAIAAAGARLGGITRVVLGHAHADHRGAAPGLGVPVFCHPAERADAEGDGGDHYFDLSKLNPLGRMLLGRLLPAWDGGPVQIAGAVEEGEDVAGFEVVHLPGHAPGLIGLWRASDRLALASDCFYTLDPQTGRKGDARVPHAAFNHDTELARASLRKLAALGPATAWAGHADPLTGDVRGALERAAATT